MNRLFTLALVFICLTGYAQPQAVLELDKKSDIIDILSLGNNGFVIKAGSEKHKEKEIQLASYRADLSLRWAVKLPAMAKVLPTNVLIVSPDAAYTYFVDTFQFSTWSKKLPEIHIVRIDSLGRREDIDYKIVADMKPSGGIALFADSENLYMLRSITTFNSKREVKKKGPETSRTESKVVLYIMNNQEKELRSVETDIAFTSDQAYADLSMEYLGHNGNYIYVAKKDITPAENIITYKIIVLDKSGKTIETKQFIADIDGKILPAYNIRNVPSAITYNNDVSLDYSDPYNLNGHNFLSFTINAGSYGCAKLDLSHGGYFYVYGLLRNSKFPLAKNPPGEPRLKEEVHANGMYVYQYDFSTGELISKDEIPFNKSILDDYTFSNPPGANSLGRDIWFDVRDSETVRICGASPLYQGVHVTVLNTRTGETTYIGKNVKQRLTMTGTYNNMHNRIFFANALVTKLDASRETIDYINKFSDVSEKNFKVLGICLGDKTILALDYAFSKTPKIEFHLLDNTNR